MLKLIFIYDNVLFIFQYYVEKYNITERMIEQDE